MIYNTVLVSGLQYSSLHACASVCVCVYIAVYMCVPVCVYMYSSLYVCACVCVCVYIYIYSSLHVCACVCVYIYIAVYMCVPVCVYIYIYSCPYLVSFPLCVFAQSSLTLCNTMDCSPPGSSVHGIFQARILEWGAISFSRDSSQLRIEPASLFVSCIGRRVLYH